MNMHIMILLMYSVLCNVVRNRLRLPGTVKASSLVDEMCSRYGNKGACVDLAGKDS